MASISCSEYNKPVSVVGRATEDGEPYIQAGSGTSYMLLGVDEAVKLLDDLPAAILEAATAAAKAKAEVTA